METHNFWKNWKKKKKSWVERYNSKGEPRLIILESNQEEIWKNSRKDIQESRKKLGGKKILFLNLRYIDKPCRKVWKKKEKTLQDEY